MLWQDAASARLHFRGCRGLSPLEIGLLKTFADQAVIAIGTCGCSARPGALLTAAGERGRAGRNLELDFRYAAGVRAHPRAASACSPAAWSASTSLGADGLLHLGAYRGGAAGARGFSAARGRGLRLGRGHGARTRRALRTSKATPRCAATREGCRALGSVGDLCPDALGRRHQRHLRRRRLAVPFTGKSGSSKLRQPGGDRHQNVRLFSGPGVARAPDGDGGILKVIASSPSDVHQCSRRSPGAPRLREANDVLIRRRGRADAGNGTAIWRCDHRAGGGAKLGGRTRHDRSRTLHIPDLDAPGIGDEYPEAPARGRSRATGRCSPCRCSTTRRSG